MTETFLREKLLVGGFNTGTAAQRGAIDEGILMPAVIESRTPVPRVSAVLRESIERGR